MITRTPVLLLDKLRAMEGILRATEMDAAYQDLDSIRQQPKKSGYQIAHLTNLAT
jgi:hypothetical protein